MTVVTADEIWRYGWPHARRRLAIGARLYVTDDRTWAYVGLRGFQRTGDYNTRILIDQRYEQTQGAFFYDNVASVSRPRGAGRLRNRLLVSVVPSRAANHGASSSTARSARRP